MESPAHLAPCNRTEIASQINENPNLSNIQENILENIFMIVWYEKDFFTTGLTQTSHIKEKVNLLFQRYHEQI